MKQKQLFICGLFLLSGLSCYADNGTHGFPKEQGTWRTKLEKDKGKVVAFSVKRNWVLFSKPDSKTNSTPNVDPDFNSYWVRNMRKKKEWDAGLIIFNAPSIPTVNIDTCKTNYTIDGPAEYLYHFSPDGRALFNEHSQYTKEIEYFSLETGKSKKLSSTWAWHALEALGGMTGFDNDSTFYTWEAVICDKKGGIVNDEKAGIAEMSRTDYYNFIGSGKVYKDYYRKVQYNTKGEKLNVGKLVSSRKMMEEYWNTSNDTLSLPSWEAKLYDNHGQEIENPTQLTDNWWEERDSLIKKGIYTYYYHRKDQWADAMISKPYTKAAVLYLEKQRWGNQNEVPLDDIYENETKYYCWMPVLCNSQGLIASDDMFPTDSESPFIDVKDIEKALHAGKIHFLYRKMWYEDFGNKYLGSDAKLYTKDEVTAIEKNKFHWPNQW